MKKRTIIFASALLIIVLNSCAAKHDSCGAYNRGGGSRGEVQLPDQK